MMSTSNHLTSETIDMLMVSALGSAAATQAQSHLEGCTDCRQHWNQLSDDMTRFEQVVFARTLPRIERRLATREMSRVRRLLRSKALLLVSALAALSVGAWMWARA